MSIFLVLLLILAILIIVKGVVIVQQAEVVIIENLGKYSRTLESGLNFIVPIIEAPRGIAWKVTQKGIDGQTYSYIKERTKIDLRESVYDFPRQTVITKDNVSISINALLYFQIAAFLGDHEAQSKYECETARISRQDNQLDMELQQLETQHEAIMKEYESVKEVISSNVDRTFGLFSDG